MEAPKEGPAAKGKEVQVIEDSKQLDKRGRSGSTSDHLHQKKKASGMQKTYLEDA